jgi:predicted lipopolysaccharide heptosyltransferase III
VNILLIRLRLIGDVVFTTPAIAALRQQYPDATISYLVEQGAAPVVRHNPHVDDVIVAERPKGWRRVAYDVALARRLRRKRFDVVIDFHGGPRSAFLARASGASRRIGYNLPGRHWAYTDRVPWTRALVPPRHSVENQADLLRPLGVAPLRPGVPAVEMPLDTQAAAEVTRRLRQSGVADDAPVAVIHASASSPFRRWPAARFAQVAAAMLRDSRDLRVVFTTGPSEQTLQAELTRMTREIAGVDAGRVVDCGDFDLPQLRALIERAAVYIGGDSGPLHIAATTKTPIVALFGPTVPERSLPWRDPALRTIAVDAGQLPCRPCDQRHCAPGDFRCLNQVTVEHVAAAAAAVLRPPPA